MGCPFFFREFLQRIVLECGKMFPWECRKLQQKEQKRGYYGWETKEKISEKEK